MTTIEKNQLIGVIKWKGKCKAIGCNDCMIAEKLSYKSGGRSIAYNHCTMHWGEGFTDEQRKVKALELLMQDDSQFLMEVFL